MKRILLSVFILFFIACWSNSFGQKVDPKNYDKFIEEVYGGTPYTTEWHRERYINFMQKVEVKKWDGQEYPILETLYLVNKYHPEINYDFGGNFNPNRFNPLKYFFHFQGNKKVFKVRDTKYMIVIEDK